jgi:hypothetical protein
MKSTQPAARKTAATKAIKARGNMKPAEIKPLVMAARKAFDRQSQAGNIDTGETFDTWRHDQCMAAVAKPGITACNHDDFRPLLAHFQTLAGDDGSAFSNLMKSGKPTDHAERGDTHEARRQLAHNIAEILNAHLHLATSSPEKLLAESVEVFSMFEPGQPWESSAGPAAFRKLLDRKAAIDLKGKGPITVGYVVYLVRQKTRRPDLVLGHDWQAGLAERCTVKQLAQIRDTLVNRINAVEGVGDPHKRNVKQRSPKAKAARDSNQVQPRW